MPATSTPQLNNLFDRCLARSIAIPPPMPRSCRTSPQRPSAIGQRRCPRHRHATRIASHAPHYKTRILRSPWRPYSRRAGQVQEGRWTSEERRSGSIESLTVSTSDELHNAAWVCRYRWLSRATGSGWKMFVPKRRGIGLAFVKFWNPKSDSSRKQRHRACGDAPPLPMVRGCPSSQIDPPT